jgi:hypothetical protein
MCLKSYSTVGGTARSGAFLEGRNVFIHDPENIFIHIFGFPTTRTSLDREVLAFRQIVLKHTTQILANCNLLS